MRFEKQLVFASSGYHKGKLLGSKSCWGCRFNHIIKSKSMVSCGERRANEDFCRGWSADEDVVSREIDRMIEEIRKEVRKK